MKNKEKREKNRTKEEEEVMHPYDLDGLTRAILLHCSSSFLLFLFFSLMRKKINHTIYNRTSFLYVTSKSGCFLEDEKKKTHNRDSPLSFCVHPCQRVTIYDYMLL